MQLALIPGTGGVGLHANGVSTGYPLLMLAYAQISKLPSGRPAEELRVLLSMEHAAGVLAPVRSSLQANTTIRGGNVLGTPYNQLADDYDRFPYDWRCDIRHSAQQLLRWLEIQPTRAPFHIACHSQGGLLVVVAAQMCAQENNDPLAFSRLVKRVAFVGVPFFGTINAAEAILKGEIFGKQAASDIKRAIRTWPAIFQMLPMWDALDGPGEFLDDATWATRYPDVELDLVKRARDTAATYLMNPAAGLQGVETLVVFGQERATKNLAKVTATEIVIDDALAELGDGLVPKDLTYEALPSIMTNNKLFFARHPEHAMLFTSASVVAHVDAFLRAP